MLKPQIDTDETPQIIHTNGDGWHIRCFGWLPWPRGNAAPQQIEQAYNRFLHSLKDRLSDLSTMEVNSVLAKNISADHPLTDLDFLRQTGEDLSEWFNEHHISEKIQKSLGEESLTQLKKLAQGIAFPLREQNKASITALRKESEECLNDANDKSDQINEAEVYQRAEYRRFLRYLQKFLLLCESNAWDTTNMGPGRERQQLRKLWELVGTTFVYAQTVSGLDGDVVSRINEQLFHLEPKLSRENIEALIRFHNHNTEASAQGRNSLIAILMDTLRAVLRR